MNAQQFKDFRESVERELTLTRDNAQEMIQRASNLSLRYLDVFIREKIALKAVNREKDRIYKDRYIHHRHHGDYKVDTKAEAESFVKGDDEYLEIAKRCDAQEIIVEYCSEAYSRASKMTYNTKQYLEYEQLKVGVVR